MITCIHFFSAISIEIIETDMMSVSELINSRLPTQVELFIETPYCMSSARVTFLQYHMDFYHNVDEQCRVNQWLQFVLVLDGRHSFWGMADVLFQRHYYYL